MPEMWTPKLGDEVWYNHPDHPDPIGKVVGFVPGDAGLRAGQPIIERYSSEGITFLDTELSIPDKVVIHPRFLLPFEYRGPEWRKHDEAGLIR